MPRLRSQRAGRDMLATRIRFARDCKQNLCRGLTIRWTPTRTCGAARRGFVRVNCVVRHMNGDLESAAKPKRGSEMVLYLAVIGCFVFAIVLGMATDFGKATGALLTGVGLVAM